MLDVNVYLEIAELLGPPFSWAAFDAAMAKWANAALPCADNYRVDSLRTIAMCTSGRFAGDDPVEVWSSAHIDRLVRLKASQPIADPFGGDRRGLGWTDENAQRLLDELVVGITARSNGGTLGEHIVTDGDPPLDHEDGLVYGACRVLAGDDLLSNVICVTRDKGFLKASRDGRLSNHSKVVSPPQMVAIMREARARLSVRRMPKPGS